MRRHLQIFAATLHDPQLARLSRLARQQDPELYQLLDELEALVSAARLRVERITRLHADQAAAHTESLRFHRSLHLRATQSGADSEAPTPARVSAS